tara:strand:+ start:713 stop:1327 length:615 start_codon:yes stop_codon:yes gene_type:complete
MAYIASEDYTAKRIYLHADTATATSLDLINVYLEHIIRRAANANGERRFPRMVLSIGNESAGGEFTPQYVDMQNGVRLVPYNTSHAPLITPTPLISRNENLSGRDLFDRSSLTSGVEVDIDYRPEISGFKIVNVSGGSTDLSSIETKSQADARQALLIAQHAATQAKIETIGAQSNTTTVTTLTPGQTTTQSSIITVTPTTIGV